MGTSHDDSYEGTCFGCVLSLVQKPGDLTLDSFAGHATTGPREVVILVAVGYHAGEGDSTGQQFLGSQQYWQPVLLLAT